MVASIGSDWGHQLEISCFLSHFHCTVLFVIQVTTIHTSLPKVLLQDQYSVRPTDKGVGHGGIRPSLYRHRANLVVDIYTWSRVH